MSPIGLADDIRRFLVDSIGSVVQLEALLLVRRSEREWSAEELSRELRIERDGAVVQLDELVTRGLLERVEVEPPTYRFDVANRKLGGQVTRLAQAYEDHRVTVISLIYSKPTATIRVFADAFRLRRDDDDG